MGRYYCYRKDRDAWQVRKSINGRMTAFGTYKSEDMAKSVVEKLKAVDWDKSKLAQIQQEVGSSGNYQRKQENKNYTYDHKRKSFRVSKIIKGKRVNFGDYAEKWEAKQVVDLLNHYGWNKDNLPMIHEKLGFEGKKRKHYYYNKALGKFTVFKNIKGKDIRFGNYETEEDAKIIVKEMERLNWDKSQLKEVWWEKKIAGTINCKPKYYYYSKEKDLYYVKFGETNHGYFTTKKEAKEYVDKHLPKHLESLKNKKRG